MCKKEKKCHPESSQVNSHKSQGWELEEKQETTEFTGILWKCQLGGFG